LSIIKENWAKLKRTLYITSLSKKRKADSDVNSFKISEQMNILCLICGESISVLKEYNIARHHNSKHKSTETVSVL
jgi:hypothetical protein